MTSLPATLDDSMVFGRVERNMVWYGGGMVVPIGPTTTTLALLFCGLGVARHHTLTPIVSEIV